MDAASIAGLGASFFRPALAGIVPYEPGKPIEEVQRELGLERVVKLASNEGPFPPLPAALEALARGAASSTATRTAASRAPPGARGAARVRAGAVAPAAGADGAHPLPLAGLPRPGRRGRLRLAVVPELRARRPEARCVLSPCSAYATTATTWTASRGGERADEARLRLQSEQPDRDDGQPGRARRVLRRVPDACPDSARRGVLRVRRGADYPDGIEEYVKSGTG